MKKIILLTTIASALSAQAATTVHDGLVAYWNLDGNGNDTASSLAGNANTVNDNLTVNGTAGAASITTSGGRFGGSADFERQTGTDASLRAADSVDVSGVDQSISISLWSQFDNDVSGNWQSLVVKGENSNYRLSTNRNANANNASYAGGAGDLNSGVNIRDAAWHHIVVTTTEGGATQIYVDGALEGTNNGPASIGLSDLENTNGVANDLFIGNHSEDNARQWDGRIDDIGIWNRALTASEVSEIFNANVSLGSIPEPSSTALLGLGGLAFILRRRK